MVSTNEVRRTQLLKMDWKLSTTISSNHCKNLDTPFVTLIFTLQDANEKIFNRSVIMDIQQFQEYSKQLREVRDVLGTSS
nr:COMM domain-containing protein 6-like [Hydra vulgaris]